MTAPNPGPWVEAWLSAPRFGVYLSAAAGDRSRALALYEWNSAVTAAFLHDLAHLEVRLRNAYDVALSAGIPAGQPHWAFNAWHYFPVVMKTAKNGTRYDANEINRDQIDRAIRATSSPGPAAAPRAAASQPPPGKVVAELMFGFWRFLSTAAHDHPLWIPHLHKAFTPGTSRRQVDEPIGRLHKLRNRVAHHEPLLTVNLAARCADVLTLAAWISDDMREYIAAHSVCAKTISSRP